MRVMIYDPQNRWAKYTHGVFQQNRSGTVKRSAASNGGTASDPGRSRIGDRCALISGRSVQSHQCRRPTNPSASAVAHSAPAALQNASERAETARSRRFDVSAQRRTQTSRSAFSQADVQIAAAIAAAPWKPRTPIELRINGSPRRHVAAAIAGSSTPMPSLS